MAIPCRAEFGGRKGQPGWRPSRSATASCLSWCEADRASQMTRSGVGVPTLVSEEERVAKRHFQVVQAMADHGFEGNRVDIVRLDSLEDFRVEVDGLFPRQPQAGLRGSSTSWYRRISLKWSSQSRSRRLNSVRLGHCSAALRYVSMAPAQFRSALVLEPLLHHRVWHRHPRGGPDGRSGWSRREDPSQRGWPRRPGWPSMPAWPETSGPWGRKPGDACSTILPLREGVPECMYLRSSRGAVSMQGGRTVGRSITRPVFVLEAETQLRSKTHVRAPLRRCCSDDVKSSVKRARLTGGAGSTNPHPTSPSGTESGLRHRPRSLGIITYGQGGRGHLPRTRCQLPQATFQSSDSEARNRLHS